MCGIAGSLTSRKPEQQRGIRDVAVEMAETLHHRGPDDQGVWVDEEVGIALAHTRLSILDLSPLGHQPMVSRSGRFIIVFNGEIYNFQEISARLAGRGHTFRGHSDTEVLLEAVADWGVDAVLRDLVGMFAFGIWDREQRKLVLARDRIGEKPLYYGWAGTSFLFGSELKALRAHPAWRGEVDRQALTLYLRNGYVPAPYTIYQGIRKLPPGCLLRIAGFTPGSLPEPEAYWRLQGIPSGSPAPPRSDAEAVDGLEELLTEAVRGQMVADVPLGAFLSGGVDSATVVALMQAVSSRPVRTFTIGVRDPAHDEAVAARAIAAHLGTDHTEQYVTPDDALALIPRLSTIYDEPFADSSQIPTLLVSELARRHVTVSLSGDGGDELFAGYERYVSAPRLVERLGRIPAPFRDLAGRALLARSVQLGFDALTRLDGGLAGERARRLGEILASPSPLTVHRALHSSWPMPQTVVRGGSEPATLLTESRLPWSAEGFGQHMVEADALTYLPDDLLVKVDRAAMAVSLETRVPLLDHRIVEFATRLPWRFKVRDGVRKWIMRQVLYRHVPRHLVDGPKRGFAVPVGQWLRGPLRDWAGDLLSRDRIEADGYFHHAPITTKWSAHLRGAYDWSYPLWAILMFNAWHDSQRQAPLERPASQELEVRSLV
jgi:asparagine synthase (glutamine-hydrolysing)